MGSVVYQKFSSEGFSARVTEFTPDSDPSFPSLLRYKIEIRERGMFLFRYLCNGPFERVRQWVDAEIRNLCSDPAFPYQNRYQADPLARSRVYPDWGSQGNKCGSSDL